MSVRKIRLTLSSTIKNSIGALIDVDFNNENLDVDVDIAAEYGVATLVKEYTVDVAAGTYNLDISYKNDVADDTNGDGNLESDRNLVIEQIEIANDGVNYQPFVVNTANTNIESYFEPMGYIKSSNPAFNAELAIDNSNHPKLLNTTFDIGQPRTDDDENGYIDGSDPGANAKYQYEFVINPVIVYTTSTVTFQLSFV